MHIHVVTQKRPAQATVAAELLTKISTVSQTIVNVRSAVDAFQKS